jgi:Domain of unknown function (DUF4148)
MKRQHQCYVWSAAAATLLVFMAGCESLNNAALDATAEVAEAPISRAQVVAELREAQRLGLVTVGEGDVPEATVEQARLIAAAGEKAATSEKVASK